MRGQDLRRSLRVLPVADVLFVIGAIILALCAIWVRFEEISCPGLVVTRTWQGVNQWVEGKPIMSRHYAGEMIYVAAVAVFGLTDHIVKVVNGVLDCASMLLIFLIARRLAESRWAGLCAVALYAFAPLIVYFVRGEMPHVPAIFYGLCAFACFLRYSNDELTNGPLGIVWLGVAALFSGLAASAHITMAYLGPGYVVLIMLVVLRDRFSKRALFRFLRDAALFASCFMVGLMLFIIWRGMTDSFESVRTYYIDYAQRRTSFIDSYISILSKTQLYEPSPIDRFFSYLTVGLRCIVDCPYTMKMYSSAATYPVPGRNDLYALLFCGSGLFMFLLAKKGLHLSREMYFPLLLVLVYVGGLAASPASSAQYVAGARHLTHVFALITISIATWWFRGFLALDKRLAGSGLVALTAIVLLSHPMIFPGNPELQRPQNAGKELFTMIGDAVDADSRLLVVPYDIGRLGVRWIQEPVYFGAENVVHVRYQPFDGGSLPSLCEKRNIRFIYLSKHATPNPSCWDGGIPNSQLRDIYGLYHGEAGPETERFSKTREMAILQRYLKESKAVKLLESQTWSFSVYLLPRPGDELLDLTHPIGRLVREAARFEASAKIEELKQRYASASMTCQEPLTVDVTSREFPRAERMGITWPAVDSAKPATIPAGHDLFVEGWCASPDTPDIRAEIDGIECKVRYYPMPPALDKRFGRYPYRTQWIVKIASLRATSQSILRVSMNDILLDLPIGVEEAR